VTSKFLGDNRWLPKLSSEAARFIGLLALLGTGTLLALSVALGRTTGESILVLSLPVASTVVKALIWIGIGIVLQKVVPIIRESKILA